MSMVSDCMTPQQVTDINKVANALAEDYLGSLCVGGHLSEEEVENLLWTFRTEEGMADRVQEAVAVAVESAISQILERDAAVTEPEGAGEPAP